MPDNRPERELQRVASVPCPSCGKPIAIPRDFMGAQITCEHCGSKMSFNTQMSEKAMEYLDKIQEAQKKQGN
ncbi:hypothetical protein [Butyrivibrio proteoclasticus]|uniref:hypothetical protein n=1 Tax=Butyrivibrio proteoclasticus TaxID=43305 RepID=UPI00047A8C39|nr:hypothetical protein [Butyrivibrio proteoclasticus]